MDKNRCLNNPKNPFIKVDRENKENKNKKKTIIYNSIEKEKEEEEGRKKTDINSAEEM